MAKTIQTKKCSSCKQIKSVSDFHKSKSVRDGLQIECKLCRSQYLKQYYRENRDEKARHATQYYWEHRAERLQYAKNHRYRHTIRGHLMDVWTHMRHRCNNPKHKKYHHYGGRGIQIKFTCFQDFYEYIKELMAQHNFDPRLLCIDRTNNDGHYERGNIRFITRAESNYNRRMNNLRNSKGQFISLKQIN